MSARSIFLQFPGGQEPKCVRFYLERSFPPKARAALEEDENLFTKWAGLLESAATSNEAELSLPNFPKILSEMALREAIILEKLHRVGGEWIGNFFVKDPRGTLGYA